MGANKRKVLFSRREPPYSLIHDEDVACVVALKAMRVVCLWLNPADGGIIGSAEQVVGVHCLDDTQWTSHVYRCAKSLPKCSDTEDWVRLPDRLHGMGFLTVTGAFFWNMESGIWNFKPGTGSSGTRYLPPLRQEFAFHSLTHDEETAFRGRDYFTIRAEDLSLSGKLPS